MPLHERERCSMAGGETEGYDAARKGAVFNETQGMTPDDWSVSNCTADD